MRKARASSSYDHDYGRDLAMQPPRAQLKRGLLGATACSVSDAFELRDYEITLLRRSHLQLRQSIEAREAEVQAEITTLRREAHEREAELERRLAILDREAKQRDKALLSELDRLRRSLAEGGWGRSSKPSANADASQPPAEIRVLASKRPD